MEYRIKIYLIYQYYIYNRFIGFVNCYESNRISFRVINEEEMDRIKQKMVREYNKLHNRTK
jgi:hypothetical protein